MNIEEKIEQAHLAASCIPVIEEKIRLVEQEFVTAIKDTDFKDDKKRQNFVTALHICEKVLEYLINDISDANYAHKTLKDVGNVDRTLVDRIKDIRHSIP